MLEYNVTRDDFESNEDWEEFIYDLNNDVSGPYYGTANVTGSYTLRPGYIMSFYQRGTMDALALQKMFSVIDPNDNLFPSLLEQYGLTNQYNADVEFLSEVNRWLDELEIFLRGDQGEDDDGRFRAIEAREWRELLEEFKDGNATVRQVRDFFENVSYLPELEGWNDYEQEVLSTSPFRAPRTWEQVKRVLESNGYTPEEIQTIKDSIRAPGGEFQGSLVLPGILRDLGYDDAGWWDVRPAAGQPCEITGGFGTYDADGNCLDSGITGQEGDPCGYGGVRDEYGTCVNQDYSCNNEQYATNNPGECGEQEEVDCSDPANANLPECEDKGFQDYVNEVGEDVANTAKGVYDEFKDVITECVNGPLDCIKKIGDVLATQGIPEKCKNLESCATADGTAAGGYCWKDCVNFSVLAGLPIPIPLPPGMVDVGTYRDFENGLKTIGKTVGDIIEGNASCGPNNDQDCTFDQVLTDLKDWVVGNVQDAMDALGDYDLDDAYDWLKGILGGVFATVIWEETKEEVADVIGVNLPITGETKDCTDEAGEVYATVGIDQECPPPPVDATFDCASVNKNGGMVETEAQCGGCLQGYDPDGQGGCTEAPIECPGEQVYNELTGQCEDPEPGFVKGDPCKTETGDSGTYDADGTCIPDPEEPQPEGCEAVDCSSPRPSAATFEGQAAYRLWNECCGTTHCPDGSLQQEGFDCAGNPTGPQEDDPCDSTGDGYNDGTIVNGECVPTPTGEDCPNGATNFPDCDECPQGQSLVNGQCLQDTAECDQQNRVTNDDGSCGECKPGFTPDPEGFDQCIQAPPECNDCSCAEYAAANPIECTTCPEGQEYCEATGACATAEECANATDDGTDDGTGGNGGGGGGGFGGGRGMFQPYTATISADPQLLSRSEFPITDFLAGIFTNSRGGRNV